MARRFANASWSCTCRSASYCSSERNVGTVALRQIPDPPGIRQAKTLPASAYSNAEFHERERTTDLPTRLDVRRHRRRDADSGIDHCTRGGWSAGAVRPRQVGRIASVPQRLPPSRVAAVRGRRDALELADPLPIPLVALPTGWLTGASVRRRRTRRLRRRGLRAEAGAARRVASDGVRVLRQPAARRSTSARSAGPSTRYPLESMELVAVGDQRSAVQLEGAAGELLGELPHAIRAPGDRHQLQRGLPDDLRRDHALRVGSAAAPDRVACRRDPADVAARRAGVGGAGVGRRWTARTASAATSRCGRT